MLKKSRFCDEKCKLIGALCNREYQQEISVVLHCWGFTTNPNSPIYQRWSCPHDFSLQVRLR